MADGFPITYTSHERWGTGKCDPRGVLLSILGGGVPPGSPNPDPISDQKMSFFTSSSTPVFRPGGGHKTQHAC